MVADDRLLTTAEAAARLSVGKHTLEVWRMQRQGPAYRKLGGRIVRYAAADLEAFVAASARQSTDEGGAEGMAL
jgi:excisionase family DNA binding protein